MLSQTQSTRVWMSGILNRKPLCQILEAPVHTLSDSQLSWYDVLCQIVFLLGKYLSVLSHHCFSFLKNFLRHWKSS